MWSDTFVDENTLSQSISTLRRSLFGRAAGRQQFHSHAARARLLDLSRTGYQKFQPLPRRVPPQTAQPAATILPHALLLEDRMVRTQVVTEHDQQTVATGRALLRVEAWCWS